MQTLQLAGSSTIHLVDAPDPVPGPGEVVIQTAVSAICGSEMHTYRGAGLAGGGLAGAGNAGHEAVGMVAALGEGVADLQIGQRVGASAIAGCGHCAACARGQYTWCSDYRFYGSMHAQSFLAAARACYPLPDDVPWEAAVLLTGDGLGVPYHTSNKIAAPEIQSIAVFGVGPIGLGNVLFQSALGRRVIAVDLVRERLDLARQLGAAQIVYAGAGETGNGTIGNDKTDAGDAVQQVRGLTDGIGADVCIEASGSQKGALDCFGAVRTAGTVVFNGEQGPLPLSPSQHFIRRDVTAVGSWFYHYGEIPAMIELYRGGLPVLDLVTHRFSYLQAAKAYALFASRKTGKVLLEWAE